MSWFKKNKKGRAQKSAVSAKGDGGHMDEMVRMLVAAPEDERVSILNDRLAVFADLEPGPREESMRGMLVAALKLPDDEYQKIAAARFKTLQSFPSNTQTMLMKSHAAVVNALPGDQRAKEMTAMNKVVSGLPEDKRAQTMKMMQNLGLMDGAA
ncbi:MAG: hypothetical protein ACC652_12265 [Acidimicrobiales bacterium]